MMPENDQERRQIVITFSLKILVSGIVAVAVTILFVRSNQMMFSTPTLVKKVYNSDDTGLMANNSENRLVLNAVNRTMVNSTKDIVSDYSLSQKQESILRNEQEMTQSVAQVQTLNTNLQGIKGIQSGKTRVIQDDYFVVKPTLYWKKLNGYMTNNEMDKNTPIYNVEDNKSEVNMKNGIYQMDTGSSSINNEYSTIGTNTIPLSGENYLNSHYNVTNSFYNLRSYKYKETEIPVDEIKLVTDGQSEQINTIEDLLPSGSGSNAYRSHSHRNFKALHPTGQALHYRPSASMLMKKRQQSKYVPNEEYYEPISQQPSNINHSNNRALLPIALGIFKLMTNGVLQIIFLGFKLKLYFIAIFTKLLLFMKLVKFFKVIMLPAVILLSSLSMFASMRYGTNNPLATSSTQLSLLNILLPNLFNNMEESSSSGSSSSSSSSSSSGGSSSSFSSSVIPSDTPPDLLQFLFDGSSRKSRGRLFLNISRDSRSILHPDLSSDGTIRSEIESPSLSSKVQDSNLFSRKRYKAVNSFDPTLKISQKILDSEKYVERIACRLAIIEKAGIIPLWIKLWILKGILKLIPEEKNELYLKTYNFVNNEIETSKTSFTPDNWADWCLQHYNSNNIKYRK